MNILAFDTSFSACTIGLLHNDRISTIDRLAPMEQSRLILPLITELLSKHSLSLASLDAIAYGCGPGSFTGVRIAKCVAQGIGFAVQKNIIPVSSLALLAQSAWMTNGWEKIAVCVDARMGQVHWAEYVINNSETTVTSHNAERTCTPEELLANFPTFSTFTEWHGIGDGWAAYEASLSKITDIKPERVHKICAPRADALLMLAEVAVKNGE